MKPATIYPALFCVILGLLLWKPWSQDADDAVVKDSPVESPQVEEPESKSMVQVLIDQLPDYEFGEASRDGIGKFYMGREISQVMGHEGIRWLERDVREEEERPSRVIEALDFAPNAVVADIGAGSGYYTFRLAPLVPDGEVVAVDIQPEMIAHLEDRAREMGVDHVRAHQGSVTDIGLDAHSIDAAIMVDAYHEFSHPAEMMASIFVALRPGGKVILLEYRAEDSSVPIKPLHKMTEAQVRKEMEVVGFEFVVNHDMLPWQHFMVFEKP